MEKYLYRFRSPEALLGQFQELEKQEIYFASPTELNDPMEGFRDVFWQGDKVIWMNLYRHYLHCLISAYSQWMILGEEEKIEWNHVPLKNPYFPNDEDLPIAKIHREIEGKFFSKPNAEFYFEALANRTTNIRRDELRAHLQIIHPLAFSIIAEQLASANLGPPINLPNKQREHIDSVFKSLNTLVGKAESLLQENASGDEALIAMFSAWGLTQTQLNIIHNYSNKHTVENHNKNFIISRFPGEYVDHVESILYPNIYTASFTGDCTDAALWSYYGNNHTGICLQFSPKTLDCQSFIELETVVGFDMKEDIKEFRPHVFSKVQYSDEWVNVDFFRSIGGLPAPTLSKYWLFSPTGDRSKCADVILNDIDNWRKRYWEVFERCGKTKLNDWKHEKEQRLLLHSLLSDAIEPSSRTLRYRFESLSGIVFGMKTPIEQRVEICKIIERKCKAENRRDFKFFQTYYSPLAKRIELAEMNLLSFDAQ